MPKGIEGVTGGGGVDCAPGAPGGAVGSGHTPILLVRALDANNKGTEVHLQGAPSHAAKLYNNFKGPPSPPSPRLRAEECHGS